MYESSWKEFNFITHRLGVVFMTFLPGVILIYLPLYYFVKDELVVLLPFSIWSVFLAYYSFKLFLFRCPRCSKMFFHNWLWLNLFRKTCVNCGLQLGEVD